MKWEASQDRAAASNRPWQVETNGVNRIAEGERAGTLADLFWIWFAANIGILAIVYGGIILSFGLNVIQGLIVVLLGSASFFLVGAFSVAGRDGGAPMMTLSRAVFGIWGNIAPNLVSWVSLVGWETLTVITGTFALMALFGMVLPLGTAPLAILSMIVMLGLTIVAGLLGQATLVVIQTWASYLFGVLTLLVAAFLIPGTHWHTLLDRPAGPWLGGFVPALTIVVAGTGLSWANAAADYSRYLPRQMRSASIVWASALGGALPLIALMSTGLLLATHDPSIATASNPISAIQSALPAWAAVPYLIAAAGGLVTEANLSLYSSGLNLLNMFVPWPRYQTVLIDAVIVVLGTVYVVLVAQNFFGPFESFLVLLGVGLAAWAGAFLAHQLWRCQDPQNPYPDGWLYGPAASTGAAHRGVSWPAVIAWGAGVVVGLSFTSSPLFHGPFAYGIFASSSLEVVFAFIVSALLLVILTPRSHTAPPTAARPVGD
ncbi:MAG: cytosine permease [Thermaerobacter sp.]|nr:cytosine permease [Thermaerobacter sp.]